MNPIQIHHVTIRQDAEGRYCLNDLHKASGGANRHRPSLWLANQRTKGLIAEIELEAGIPASNSVQENKALIRALSTSENKAGIPAYSTTQKSGTFVVKELVYAYAMWISPAFHLQVIRAYDALVNGHLNQYQNTWFAKRPHWLPIRTMVMQGKTYGEVASLIGRSVGSVRYAVKRMIEWGLINPAILAQVQKGIAKLHSLKRSQLWGQQLHLFG